MKDFFISYTHADKNWAEWIATSLERHGYTLTIQAWDFRPGANFVLEMQKATLECERTIGVLSPDWLASVFSQPEWAAAFVVDPTGATRKFVPIRVRPCEPAGLLKAIVYCDLVGLEEDVARQNLLDGVSKARVSRDGVFPPSMPPRLHETSGNYPGSLETVEMPTLPDVCNAAFKLLSLLRTTEATFASQTRLRDDLVRHIHERLILNPLAKWKYEDFFVEHYPGLDATELRMFSTMRSFTENILAQFNDDILKLIEDEPGLYQFIRSLPELKNHLLIWQAKFKGTFLGCKALPLNYVWVDEGVPFPQGIEMELWELLTSNPRTKGLVAKEPPPSAEFQEHQSSDGHWVLPLRDKFLFKRLTEIERERQHRANTGGTRLSNTLQSPEEFRLDIEQAELLESKFYPLVSCRPTLAPRSLLVAIKGLLENLKPERPAGLKDTLESAQPLIEKVDTEPFALKKLILLLPIIGHYSRGTPEGAEFAREWENFRTDLTRWTLEVIEPHDKTSNR